MNVGAYVKMNGEELAKEIEKQKKKIKTAQETIKLLEKLAIAENAKAAKPGNQQPQFQKQQFEG